MNSLSVWQPEENVNDLGEAFDQPMEPIEGGDREGETEGVELEVSGPLRDYLQEEDHLEDQHRKLEQVRLAAVKNEAGIETQEPGAPPPAVLQTHAQFLSNEFGKS